MALSPSQQLIAQRLYALALKKGISPERAREFVAAGYAESGLDPRATNPSSGAAGLYQLLSSGYRQRAQSLGGLYDPWANARAILPDYASYWQAHPGARPGEAGRDVERSGEGAGFYSRPLGLLGTLRGQPTLAGGSPGTPLSTAPTTAPAAPDNIRRLIVKALLEAAPGQQPDLLQLLVRAPAQIARPAPVPTRPLIANLPEQPIRSARRPAVNAQGRVQVHGTQQPVRIILHTAESDGDPASLADFWARQGRGYGSQLAIGAYGQTARFANDTDLTYHTGGANRGSLGIEMMGNSSWTREQWLARPAQLEAVAEQIADWSTLYGIPLTLNPRRGVSTHAIQSRLHRESEGHSDPGSGFPLALVLRRARKLAGRTGR